MNHYFISIPTHPWRSIAKITEKCSLELLAESRLLIIFINKQGALFIQTDKGQQAEDFHAISKKSLIAYGDGEHKFVIMAYNSNCWSQSCNYNCCDYWGYCVSNPAHCYHYYRSPISTRVIAAAAVAGVVGLAIILCVAWRCFKRREQRRQEEIMRRRNLNAPNIPNPYIVDGTNLVLRDQDPNRNVAHPFPQNYNLPPPGYGQPMVPPSYFNNQLNQPAANDAIYQRQQRNMYLGS